MTTEEKLQHFYAVSIESAKEEASKAISQYRASLEEELEKHKKEKKAASENQFKIESENAAREVNKALSSEHLHIKRRLPKSTGSLRRSFSARWRKCSVPSSPVPHTPTGWKTR